MAPQRAAAVVLLALAASCSGPDQAPAPPPTADEQRALAEARAMIPAEELPALTPAPTQSAAR